MYIPFLLWHGETEASVDVGTVPVLVAIRAPEVQGQVGLSLLHSSFLADPGGQGQQRDRSLRPLPEPGS